ncbi:MAG: TetR/AcrR family transcriptional regulator [Candidatus Dormibacteraceae bacterium]
MSTSNPRARYREQVRAEIRAHAWEQIGRAGATALSLKAIAKQMGMSAPALYRYFSSRDELLTELILGAYRDLAETMENVAEEEGGTSPEQRLRRLGQALRGWAVADPQRYLLLYGTPVPGYAAPPEATELAQRSLAPTVAALTASASASGGAARDPAIALRRAVVAWTRLHGVLSLELAGHFAGMDLDPEQLYADEIESTSASDETPGPVAARGQVS